MSHASFRRPIVVAALALGAGLSLAPTASAAVSLTSSASYTYAGASVTLKVSSDVAKTIEIRQGRANRLSGPGRCILSYTFAGDWLAGRVLRTIDYTTPGTVVTVTIPATSLQFVGGNLLAGLPNGVPEDSRCDDYATQFTQIGAWQSAGYLETDVALRPLVRLI